MVARLILSLSLAAFLAAACTRTSDVVAARFARERACPEASVTVAERGGYVYAASGCGHSAEYVCGAFVNSSDDDRKCEERGVRPNRGIPQYEGPQIASPTGPEPPPK